MSGRGDHTPAEDPRIAAARYRQAALDREWAGPGESDEGTDAAPAAPVAPDPAASSPGPPPRAANALERAAYVETAIQQAIRRGDFDDLPGAGKPIPGLGASHDPDWWIRRKIETEKLTGLGPPALTLRTEAAEFHERLDALARESEVREAVEDFNERVRIARMQLLGGPPVTTPPRDVDTEVAQWRQRREARAEAAASLRPVDSETRRRWWRRPRPDLGTSHPDLGTSHPGPG